MLQANSSNAAQAQNLTSLCRICCEKKSGTETNFTQTIAVFFCQHHPTNAPYSSSLVYNRHCSFKALTASLDKIRIKLLPSIAKKEITIVEALL
jgi:hypothetical protein